MTYKKGLKSKQFCGLSARSIYLTTYYFQLIQSGESVCPGFQQLSVCVHEKLLWHLKEQKIHLSYLFRRVTSFILTTNDLIEDNLCLASEIREGCSTVPSMSSVWTKSMRHFCCRTPLYISHHPEVSWVVHPGGQSLNVAGDKTQHNIILDYSIQSHRAASMVVDL